MTSKLVTWTAFSRVLSKFSNGETSTALSADLIKACFLSRLYVNGNNWLSDTFVSVPDNITALFADKSMLPEKLQLVLVSIKSHIFVCLGIHLTILHKEYLDLRLLLVLWVKDWRCFMLRSGGLPGPSRLVLPLVTSYESKNRSKIGVPCDKDKFQNES